MISRFGPNGFGFRIAASMVATMAAGPVWAGMGDLDRPAPDSRVGTGVHLVSTPTLDFDQMIERIGDSISAETTESAEGVWSTVTDDTSYGADLSPAVDVIVGPVAVGVTLPMHLALYDPYAGGFGVDSAPQFGTYSTVSDVLSTVRYLWITPKNAPFEVKLDQFSAVSLGHGLLVDEFNPHVGATDAFLSGQAQARSDFVTADFYVDDVAKPSVGIGAFEARPLSFLAFPAFRTAKAGWAIVVGETDAFSGVLGTKFIDNSRLELGMDLGYDSWLDDGGSAVSAVVSTALRFGPRWASALEGHIGQTAMRNGFELGRMGTFDALWTQDRSTALVEDQAIISGLGLSFGRGPEFVVDQAMSSVTQEWKASVAMPYSRLLRVIATGALRSPRGDLASAQLVGAGTVRLGSATGLSVDTGIVVSGEEVLTNVELRIGWEGRKNRSADRTARKQARTSGGAS